MTTQRQGTRTLAFSPTEDLLAVGTWNAKSQPIVELWDVGAGKATRKLSLDVGHRSLAFSPDGKLLAAFEDQGNVKVIDWASNRLLTNLPVSPPRYTPSCVVAFSPDGSRLAIGEDYGRIRLLELRTGTLLPLPTQLVRAVTTLAFSPTGNLLAAAYGYGSGAICLWDPNTQEPRGQLTNHTDDVTALAFTPDGRTLASASADWTIRSWNVSEGAELRCLRSSREGLSALAMLPDGRTMVSGSRAGAVCLWNLAANPRPPAYTNLAVAAPVAAFTNLDAASFTTERLDPRVVRRFGLAFTPDSLRFITMDAEGSLVLGDARSLRLIENLPAFGTNHWGVALSPDGRWLATGDAEGRIAIWDWATRRSVTSFTAPFDYLGLLHFSQSSRYLTASVLRNDQTASVRLWLTDDWAEVALTGAQFAGVWSLDLSPDDRFLAGGYLNGALKLLRFPSLEPEATLAQKLGTVVAVRFSPDGHWLASTSSDGSARLWDVRARRQLADMRGHFTLVWGGALSPDGWRMATGGSGVRETVKLWDLRAHRELLSLPGSGAYVFDLAFSPDGNTLAGTSLTGTADLWRAPSWDEIETAEKRQAAD